MDVQFGPSWPPFAGAGISIRGGEEVDTDELKRAMFLEMRVLLGFGYVPDDYEQCAAPFIDIAQRFLAEAQKGKRK